MMCTGLCGGTVIDQYHILTAAHCIDSLNPATITITAGLHNKNNNEADTRQVRAVERIFKHQDYNPEAIQNDLTILRLAQPLQFNKYVQPACLPGPDPQPDADVVLIGWGLTKTGGSPYNELKQTKVKVIGDCSAKYWGPKVDDEKQFCVGDPSTGDSACQGDSGGPMLYQHNGQWVVAGVTSFGYPYSCQPSAPFMPNVYVRVSAYLPWINSII